MRPRISILSPEFRYTSSVCTDLRATFQRIRREQARMRAAAIRANAEAVAKIRTLPVAKRV